MSRIIKLGNSNPIHYKENKLGEDSVQSEYQPQLDSVTTIHISPDSTVRHGVEEIQEIWDIHSHSTNPTYIGYNLEAKSIAMILSSIYNDIEIREITE
jgi:hypothetical protein